MAARAWPGRAQEWPSPRGGRPEAGRPGRLLPRRAHVTWVMFDYGGVVSHPPTQRDLALLAGAAAAARPARVGADWGRRRRPDPLRPDPPGALRPGGAVPSGLAARG